MVWLQPEVCDQRILGRFGFLVSKCTMMKMRYYVGEFTSPRFDNTKMTSSMFSTNSRARTSKNIPSTEVAWTTATNRVKRNRYPRQSRRSEGSKILLMLNLVPPDRRCSAPLPIISRPCGISVYRNNINEITRPDGTLKSEITSALTNCSWNRNSPCSINTPA